MAAALASASTESGEGCSSDPERSHLYLLLPFPSDSLAMGRTVTPLPLSPEPEITTPAPNIGHMKLQELATPVQTQPVGADEVRDLFRYAHKEENTRVSRSVAAARIPGASSFALSAICAYICTALPFSDFTCSPVSGSDTHESNQVA